MRFNRLAVPAITLTLFSTAAIRAATVRFDVVPTNDPNATQVAVAPATEVPYDLYVQVISDNPTQADNDGLVFFTLDVTTNFGVQQPTIDAFDTVIAQAFTLVPSRGTPTDDDVIQISAGQNTILAGAAQTGIGMGTQRQLLGRGRLITPAAEGSFAVGIANTARANVLAAAGQAGVIQATVVLGPGFAVQTAVPTDGGSDGDNDDGTGGDGDDETDGGSPTTQPTTTQPVTGSAVVTGIGAIGLGALVVALAFFAFGPLAALIAVLVFPLLMLLLAIQ